MEEEDKVAEVAEELVVTAVVDVVMTVDVIMTVSYVNLAFASIVIPMEIAPMMVLNATTNHPATSTVPRMPTCKTEAP